MERIEAAVNAGVGSWQWVLLNKGIGLLGTPLVAATGFIWEYLDSSVSVKVFILAEECLHSTTDGPRGPGGVSRVSGGRDDPRAFSNKRRWIPPSSLRRDALWQENGNDVIFRKVQGILNKLTPEKFEKLSDDILAIGLSSKEILKGVILLIFKKALDEPKYSSMYAQLCKRLAEEAPNFEPPDQPNTFRTLLLNNCRTEFERRSELSEGNFQNESPIAGDDEDRISSAKRKMLGNIKFIGELGKLEILSEGILHRCIQTLLYNIYRHKGRDVSEDVECLAQIMRTCGRILDSDKGKILMDQYFDRMKSLTENTEFPLRIRFMLKDVIELRRDSWVPRKANSSEGPMPINQIRVDEKIRGGFPGGGLSRPNPNAGLDGLFRNPLKTRAGLDDVLGVSNFSTPSQLLPHHDNYNKGFVGNNNGFNGSNSYRSNRGNTGVFFGGRHGNNYSNNKQNSQQHFSNSGGGKDVPPRFKKNLLPVGGGSLIEDISLRPAASLKPPQPKPTPTLGGMRGAVLLSEPLLPSPQIQMAKETPILIKQASADKGKASKRDKGPSKEEVMTRMNSVLEKLTAENMTDSGVEIKNIKYPERMQAHIINHIFNHYLNKNESERKMGVDLISELKKTGGLNGDKILEATRELVSNMADKEPGIVTGYIRDCILMELVSLAAVAEMTEGGEHYPLFLLVLQTLLQVEGDSALLLRFNESKVNLMSHVAEADRTKERLSEILDQHDITFLYPLSSIQSSLWKQLSVDPNPTQFYKWVKENMDPNHHTNPDFISALATVIIKYIAQESSGELIDMNCVGEKQPQDKEKFLLEKYKPILQAFLHDRADLQMIAIYSLQVLCYSLQFPKGMLLRWFMNLYDLEIVEEEAFMKWKEDITDAYPGKGDSLFQVNQWLIWLAEAEEEEEEDEEVED